MFNAEQARQNASEYNQRSVSYILDAIEERSKEGFYNYRTNSLEENEIKTLKLLGFSIEVDYDDYYGRNTYEISW